MTHQATSPEVDITQTMLWVEPTLAYLKLMSPGECLLHNNMRIIIQELTATKQTQDKILKLLVETRKKMGVKE